MPAEGAAEVRSAGVESIDGVDEGAAADAAGVPGAIRVVRAAWARCRRCSRRWSRSSWRRFATTDFGAAEGVGRGMVVVEGPLEGVPSAEAGPLGSRTAAAETAPSTATAHMATGTPLRRTAVGTRWSSGSVIRAACCRGEVVRDAATGRSRRSDESWGARATVLAGRGEGTNCPAAGPAGRPAEVIAGTSRGGEAVRAAGTGRAAGRCAATTGAFRGERTVASGTSKMFGSVMGTSGDHARGALSGWPAIGPVGASTGEADAWRPIRRRFRGSPTDVRTRSCRSAEAWRKEPFGRDAGGGRTLTGALER